MSTAGPASAATEGGDLAERRVTPLELFFDLVFVFALTQVTGFLADHLTWVGTLQGAALLVVLWWAWGAYSWLTNAVPAEEAIPARLVILTAMAAMLVASLAVPDAFGRYGVLFGLAYFVVRRRGPLPSRTQRLQAARRRERKRPQVGGDGPLLRAHPRSGVGALPHQPRHPGGATVRAGRLRNHEISRVPARAACALEAQDHDLFTEARMGRIV